MTNTISTATLAAGAKAGVIVDEYRGYEIVDNDDYVTICRNAAVIQCAHTPAQARAAIDEIVDAGCAGKLITSYRGYDIREAARQGGISMGVEVFRGDEFIVAHRNVATAKSEIDFALAKFQRDPDTPAPAAQPAPEMTAEQRKARNAKLLGRRENNPNDLI